MRALACACTCTCNVCGMAQDRREQVPCSMLLADLELAIVNIWDGYLTVTMLSAHGKGQPC